MRIFKMLANDRLCVSMIVKNLNVTQPTVTQHLKILQHAGLVKSEKIGSWVHYSADISGIKRYKKELEEFIDILDSASEKEHHCRPEKCGKKSK